MADHSDPPNTVRLSSVGVVHFLRPGDLFRSVRRTRCGRRFPVGNESLVYGVDPDTVDPEDRCRNCFAGSGR